MRPPPTNSFKLVQLLSQMKSSKSHWSPSWHPWGIHRRHREEGMRIIFMERVVRASHCARHFTYSMLGNTHNPAKYASFYQFLSDKYYQNGGNHSTRTQENQNLNLSFSKSKFLEIMWYLLFACFLVSTSNHHSHFSKTYTY